MGEDVYQAIFMAYGTLAVSEIQSLGFGGGSVAVGTPIAGRPPRRSQRAGLPHWAPALGSGVEPLFGPGVQDADGW
jgi:hypothetical protein